MDDAVSFIRSMQSLAKDHPKYYKYIIEGQQRVLEVNERFRTIFLENPEVIDRMRNNFAEDLRRKNQHSKVYSEEALEDMINKFEVEDVGMMLDQIFMLDFMSAIRNKATGQATLSTLTTKDAINMFSEGWDYNQAMSGQLDVIESVMSAVSKAVDGDKATTKFLKEVKASYKNVRNDIESKVINSSSQSDTKSQEQVIKHYNNWKSIKEGPLLSISSLNLINIIILLN